MRTLTAISATAIFIARSPTPKQTATSAVGELTSKQLRMADLRPLIGVDSGKGSAKTEQAKAKRGEKSTQSADRVLPHDKFDTKNWGAIDADVKFSGKRIEHGSLLPLSDLYTHLQLKNGDLLLDPLRFGTAGDALNSTVHLEGDKSPMRVRADIHARRLHLPALPGRRAMQRSLGQLNSDVSFPGTGNSVVDLLATSNGQLKLLMNDGLISRRLMEIAGLNVGNYVVGKLFGDDEVRINCAATDVKAAERGGDAESVCVQYRECGHQRHRQRQLRQRTHGSLHQS